MGGAFLSGEGFNSLDGCCEVACEGLHFWWEFELFEDGKVLSAGEEMAVGDAGSCKGFGKEGFDDICGELLDVGEGVACSLGDT